MDLNEILVFARVVQLGSFTAAGAELGLPKSSVSRKVSELEERLKLRLLQRTTRKLSLTDVGRIYYDYCARIVSEVENAEAAVSSMQAAPRGLLRVTAGGNATFLGPIVASYMKRFPEVRIELFCTHRTVDLVQERFDLGVRAGTLTDSTLIAKSLGKTRFHFVAAPAYLLARGEPESPDDLAAHDCLAFGFNDRFEVVLEHKDKSVRVAMPAKLAVSDFDILVAVAVAGMGIALLPDFMAVPHLRAHTLQRVLSSWTPPEIPVHAVYPSARHLSPTVKSFIEHLRKQLSPPPWGPAPAA